MMHDPTINLLTFVWDSEGKAHYEVNFVGDEPYALVRTLARKIIVGSRWQEFRPLMSLEQLVAKLAEVRDTSRATNIDLVPIKNED